jgi:hypothetical protein
VCALVLGHRPLVDVVLRVVAEVVLRLPAWSQKNPGTPDARYASWSLPIPRGKPRNLADDEAHRLVQGQERLERLLEERRDRLRGVQPEA